MKKNIVISLIIMAVFIIGMLVFSVNLSSAGKEKWVEAMPFCQEGMIKDAKEEMSAGKSDFDQYCKKAGRTRAVDARCNNGKFEVKCK